MRRLPTTGFFVPDPMVRRRLQARVDKGVEDTKDTLVVAHEDCPDGVGSYLVHALVAQNPPPVVWAYPGDVHHVVVDVARHAGEGRTLSINDLSFDRDHFKSLERALKAAKDKGWRIVWRDHHHKQWEGVDTDRLTQHIDSFVLDREGKECGASLAQKDLAPQDPLARELARIVRDRDLWINEDPRSEMYEMAVKHLGPQTFIERFLATRDVDAPWIQAAADDANRERNELVEEAVLSAALYGDDGEVGVVYGEVPTNAALHTLRQRRGTRLEIAMKPEGRFSVRSAKGTDVAHLLGQAYSGGGHPNAAGGVVPVKPWEWPAYWLRGGDSPAGRSVIKTALRLIKQADGSPGKGGEGDGATAVDRTPEKTVTAREASKSSKSEQGQGSGHGEPRPKGDGAKRSGKGSASEVQQRVAVSSAPRRTGSRAGNRSGRKGASGAGAGQGDSGD